MANDPDADRIGVAVKDEKEEWIYPNGNQIGLLLMNYILENKKNIPKNSAVVSTLLIAEMAAYYNSIESSIPKELKKLYEKFGYYREGIIAITKKGKDSVEAISKIMSNLRANVSNSLLGKAVVSKRDFSLGYQNQMLFNLY